MCFNVTNNMLQYLVITIPTILPTKYNCLKLTATAVSQHSAVAN